MKIHCPEFEDGGTIPDRFSQYHENRSLPLQFIDVPRAAATLVLLMEDLDGPQGKTAQWVVYNIPPTVGGFAEGEVPGSVRLGRNDSGEMAYAGPKPQCGEHSFRLRLLALDRRLTLPAGAIAAEVELAIEGRVIAEATLHGRFAAPETVFASVA